MNPKVLDKEYSEKKALFHEYIDNIKKTMKVDIYSIINVTLIKNPYNTDFPKKFFLGDNTKENKFILFIKSIFSFYTKQMYMFFSYVISYIIYKKYYKKTKSDIKDFIMIDIFLLVDNIIKDKKFNENYFKGLYEVLEKYNKNYIFLPRLYGTSKNPFKLKKLFNILNSDKRGFLFEFELLSYKDFITIFIMIVAYPFKTLRLLQDDQLFNSELIKDIEKQSFDSFSRYILGINISKLKGVGKIYSWSEFQVVERSFNYGIRTNNDTISLLGCQFYLNYETYFNSFISDIDYNSYSSPHFVLVNGKYYLKKREKVKYDIGVSLRYKDIFSFKEMNKEKDILLLGSYIESDTKYMIESIEEFDNVTFKNHPAVDISKFGKLPENVRASEENIYKLFETTKLAIGTASGTSVEAVAYGVSVIIIASQDNLTANPLVDYGKGKIWDIVFSKDDVKKIYNQLMKYRKENMEEIKEIALWYKENFFIEPTEENIIEAFELGIKE